MDVIEQIRGELNNQGISIWKFSKMLGVSEQAMYKWFNYQQNPTLNHLIDMAWLLGCEIKLERTEE